MSDERRRATTLSPPERFLLDEWCRTLRDAFQETPYLVGSAARAEPYRDVDIRIMLPPGYFESLRAVGGDLGIEALNVAVSYWGRAATGLPIDFQFQHVDEANAEHNGIRNARGRSRP